MKHLTAIILATATVATAPHIAVAQQAMINFTGKVVSSTCNIEGAAGGSLGIVLPTVPSNALAAAGKTAGSTNFEIKLTGCDSAIKSVAVAFEYDDPSGTGGRLKNNAPPSGEKGKAATNLELELLNRQTGKQIMVGAVADDSSYIDVVDGKATLTYAARYYALGKVEAGDMQAVSKFTVIYK